MTFYSTPDELLAAQRLREQVERPRVTPEQAELIEQYARMYPTMTAQATLGLAMQGLAPDSDVARRVAEAEGLELLDETRDHRGFFARARDTVLGSLGAGVGMTGDAVASTAKTVTRSAFTMFDTLQQELIKRPLRAIAYASDQASSQFPVEDSRGLIGDIADTAQTLAHPGYWTGVAQNFNEGMAQSGRSAGSILGQQFLSNPIQTTRDFVTGSEASMGSGFIPGGALSEAAEFEQQQIQIGGSGADFGDLVATTFLEPDSREHEMWSGFLQLGFDIGSDPGGAALGTATKFKQAGKLLGETRNVGFGVHVGNRLDRAGELSRGLVRAERNTILPEVVRAYTRSDEFAPIADKIMGRDTYDIFQAFGGKLDPGQARWLREAVDREDLATRIDDLLLGGQMSPQKVNLRPVKEQSRWASIMPTDAINLKLGKRNAATQLDRALIAAKVDRGERARILDRWADVPSLGTAAGRAGALDVVKDGFRSVANNLTTQGVDADIANEMVRLFDRVDDDTRYVVETLAQDGLAANARKHINIGGEVQEVDLRLVSELVQEIPLPDMRAISKEMTGGLMNSKMFETAYQTELAVSQAVLKAWVPAQLLRGAWTVRVVGEEQVRMAVSGMDSLFRHPGSFIAWAIGRKGTDDVLGEGFKATDEAGQLLDVSYDDAMARTFDAWYKPSAGKVASGDYKVTKPGEPGHWSNVTHQLRMLHNDPLARRMARGDSTDDVVNWLMADGEKTLRDVASQFPPGAAERFMQNPNAIRGYLDGVTRAAVHETTGGNQALLDLVSSGQLDGIGFKKAAQVGSDRSKLTRKVRAVLGDENAPVAAAGPKLEDATISSQLDRLVDLGMTTLMGKPTNYLSRSPTFRQAYWDRVRQLVGSASDEVRDEIIKNAAETFGVNTKEMRGLVKAMDTRPGDTITDIQQLDTAAKAHALEHTKTLLYDQARRTQWVDLTRGIFVFAEAWKEIATTWMRLASKQPNVFRRTQQSIEGMRDAGAFYYDEQNGQEMFAYPGGGWLSGLIAPGVGGDPEQGEMGTRMTAPVEGLNLFAGSVMPGVGPVVSVAAANWLPDTPDADWLRDLLFPFGSEKEEGTPGEWFEAGIPSYMKKLMQAWGDGEFDRDQYMNARFDVIRALAMADPERYAGPDGQQRALDDSKGITSNVFLLRGLGQLLGAPAAPRVEFFTTDMSGEAFNLAALSKAYWELYEESGGDHSEATRSFIDRFGVDPDLIRQGKTRSINKRAITEPGAEWEREHQEQAEAHPEVIGFFAPEDFDAQMDSTAFDRAIESGDREQLTPEIMLKSANQRTGYMVYDEYNRRLEEAGVAGADLRAAQRDLKAAIAEMYPGFGEKIAVTQRLEPEDVIPRLREAIKDPVLADTPTGQALTEYLRFRDRALQEAADKFGVSTLGGKQVLPYRQALAAVAAELIREHEGFAAVWDEVLSREIKADELEEAA